MSDKITEKITLAISYEMEVDGLSGSAAGSLLSHDETSTLTKSGPEGVTSSSAPWSSPAHISSTSAPEPSSSASVTSSTSAPEPSSSASVASSSTSASVTSTSASVTSSSASSSPASSSPASSSPASSSPTLAPEPSSSTTSSGPITSSTSGSIKCSTVKSGPIPCSTATAGLMTFSSGTSKFKAVPKKKEPSLPASKNRWCPFDSKDWDAAGFQPTAAARAKKDITSLYTNPLPGVFFIPDEQNIMALQVMILGNFDTPYEGGFFHFYIRFGPTYPFAPPRVCSMSGYKFGYRVRFNPNMYENGTVCLSILGTWKGPGWTAANNLSGVVLSIQSLMRENALMNEPGYESRFGHSQDIETYDAYVRHETLRVAVVDTVKNAHNYHIPPELVEIMKSTFLEYYDSYIESCDDMIKYDGREYKLALRGLPFKPSFATIKKSLVELHDQITSSPDPASECSSLSDLSESGDSATGRDAKRIIKQVDMPNSDENPSSSESESKTSNLQKKLKTAASLFGQMNVFTKAKSEVQNKKKVNTKIANAVQIKSSACEKLLKELDCQQVAPLVKSDQIDMKMCLDEMEFMAYSDVSDNGDSSDDEEEDILYDEPHCTVDTDDDNKDEEFLDCSSVTPDVTINEEKNPEDSTTSTSEANVSDVKTVNTLTGKNEVNLETSRSEEAGSLNLDRNSPNSGNDDPNGKKSDIVLK